MNAQSPTTTGRENGQKRRKLLAIGAGGLALGIGAAVTIAAWTDQEVATGDFAAGQFALESSTNGTDFTDTTPPAQALTLSFDEIAQKLSPGDSASAVYAIRLDQASDYAATISGTVAATGSAADNLTYTIRAVDGVAGTMPEDAAYTDQTIAVPNEPVTSATTHDEVFTLDALTEVVYLKVTVTADDALAQGETADVTWTMTGTSTDEL